MSRLNRRLFLGRLAAGGLTAVGASLAGELCLAAAPQRKFTMDLVCGAIGVRATQAQALRLGAKYGFESVAPSPGELAKLSGLELEGLRDEMKRLQVVWGAAGLPVDFRKDGANFRSGMEALPAAAAAVQRAGGQRMSTWLRPAHDELTYSANFKQHAQRLREVAKVLNDHGLRFGMEYVGPKTSWTAGRHAFIHTMAETRELIAEIGVPNVGLVLDSWHWYTAHETKQDLLTLTNKDVVACDLNDAPAGIEVDEQVDSRRELPAATGVIDLKAFLSALVEIGYDGPVRAEPFNQALRALPDEEAVAATAAAMKKAFALVG